MKLVYGDVTAAKVGIADGVVYRVEDKAVLDKVRELNTGVLKNVASKFLLVDDCDDSPEITVFSTEHKMTQFD
jgi:hypothetical protein